MVHFKTFHLFAGAGGGILGDTLLGHTPIGAIEIEKYPREVLLARQADGLFPQFPIWDDVRTFRSDNPECGEFINRLKSIREELIISGGFPCQDISAAGKGVGITGEKSGLWKEFARIISEVRPCFTFVENSPMLTSRGLGTVLGDLAEIGYNAEWCVLGADNVGAPHHRKRIWILAYPNSKRFKKCDFPEISNSQEFNNRSNSERQDGTMAYSAQLFGNVGKNNRENSPCEVPESRDRGSEKNVADTDHSWDGGRNRSLGYSKEELPEHRRGQTYGGREWWASEPSVGRVADGVAHRVDRLKAIGNGQVPAVAAEAFKMLLERILENCTR